MLQEGDGEIIDKDSNVPKIKEHLTEEPTVDRLHLLKLKIVNKTVCNNYEKMDYLQNICLTQEYAILLPI